MSVNASFLQRLSNQIKENISSECDHLELYCEEVSLNTESAVYISVTIKKKKKKVSECHLNILSSLMLFYF